MGAIMQDNITQKNLIEKICLAIYGNISKQSIEKFNDSLIAFNSHREAQLTPSVFKKIWLDFNRDGYRGVRKSNYPFLIDFIKSLNKKHDDELMALAINFIENELVNYRKNESLPIKYNDKGNVEINVAYKSGSLDKMYKKLKKTESTLIDSGDERSVFITYRHKFGYQKTINGERQSIAKEVLEIYRDRDGICNYNHYFRTVNNIDELYVMRGTIIPNNGRSLIFIGFCDDPSGHLKSRARIMVMHDEGNIDDVHGKVRGGLMISDSPIPRKIEPACVRCIHIKQDIGNEKLLEYAKRNTEFLTDNELKQKEKILHAHITDYINNHKVYDSESSNVHEENSGTMPLIASFDPILKMAYMLDGNK